MDALAESSVAVKPTGARHDDDLRLVASCLAHDESAWQTLLTAIRPMCRAIAFKYNLTHEYDDLVGDFVVKLLDGVEGRTGVLRRYDGSVKLNTYLGVVFGRMAIDRLRSVKASRVTDTATPVDVFSDRQPARHDADSLADCPGIDGLLHESIGKLADSDRRVLELYHFSKLKLREIAEMLDCSIATVSRQLQRIHDALRATLSAHPEVMEVLAHE